MKASSCRLCAALEHEPATDVVEHVVRVADAFPVVPGHALLMTTYHGGGFGHEQSRPELAALLTAVEMIEDAPYLLIEHGVRADQARLHCIDHAHVHIFPNTELQVTELLGTPAFAFAENSQLDPIGLSEVPATLMSNEYVWASDSHGTSVLLQPRAGVPSQLARRAVAEALGVTGWDWRRRLALSRFRLPR